jgi:hypothetical protein
VVRQHLQSDALLGYRHHRLLVHVRVVNTHSAEDRERLDEVLVVLGERKIVELVYQLDDADYLSRRVLDGHAQYRLVLERRPLVHAGVEPLVFLGDRYVNRLQTHSVSIWTRMEKRTSTSPVVATYPVIPTLMGNRLSKGLVLDSPSSPLRSFASKSNTLEKLIFDP